MLSYGLILLSTVSALITIIAVCNCFDDKKEKTKEKLTQSTTNNIYIDNKSNGDLSKLMNTIEESQLNLLDKILKEFKVQNELNELNKFK